MGAAWVQMQWGYPISTNLAFYPQGAISIMEGRPFVYKPIFRTQMLPKAEIAFIRRLLEGCFPVFSRLHKEAGVPMANVELHFVDDYDTEAKRNDPHHVSSGAGGATSVARNFPRGQDESDILILFDSRLFLNSSDNGEEGAKAAFVVVHELVHPMISRGRSLCSGYKFMHLPSCIARNLYDEFVSDQIASMVLRDLIKYNGKPFHYWPFFKEEHLQIIEASLKETPHIIGKVNLYKEGRIGPGALVRDVIVNTGLDFPKITGLPFPNITGLNFPTL